MTGGTATRQRREAPALIAALIPRAAATLVELAGVVFAARLLGLSLYGAYQSAAVAGGLGALALDLSRQTTGTRAVSATRALAVYQRLTTPRRRSAAALAAAAVTAYVVRLPWVGAGFAMAAATMLEQRWGLLATRRTVALGVSYLARPGAAILVLTAAAILGSSDRETAQYALPAAAVVGALLVAAFDLRVARVHLSPAPAAVEAPASVRDRIPLTLAALLAAGYVSGDLLLVRALSGPEQAGIYALAYKPVVAVLVLVALLRDLWIAEMAGGHAGAEPTSLRQAVVGSTAVTAVLAAATLVVRPLQLATGAHHADVVTALLLASVVPIVVSSWYYARAVTLNRLAAPLPAVAVALLVDVVANLALVPPLGARGGAIATLLAEVVSTAAAAWVLLRRRPTGGTTKS